MNTSKSKIFLKPILIGVFSGMICILMLLALISLLILKSGNTSEEILSAVSLIILAVSTFLAGYVSGKISKSKGIAYGICCGLILFSFMLIGSIIVGNYNITLFSVFKLIIAVIFGCGGGVIGVNKN